MRMLRVAVAVVMLAWKARSAFAQQAQLPAPPAQLVREVVYNELNDHQRHGYWRYWIERRTQNGTAMEEQVETAGGPVAWVTAGNGRPISPEARAQEQARLEHLLASPQEQARRLRQYGQDEERIGRIVSMLPDAFLYDLDHEGNGCYWLRFRPNPNYPSHSIEARIFHSMSGTLRIDEHSMRLAGLEGHINQNIDFGFGILGRIYKGGWFKLERVRVSQTDWKTQQLEVHLNIRALLVTSFARETSEIRGGFEPVPAGMNVAQGIALLEQDSKPASSAAVSAALALIR